MSLLAVGTVAFDDIQTPFGHAEKAIGGAATYITLAASYLTNDIRLVSVVGDDFPQETLNEMTKRGIDLEGLQVKHGQKSFFWAGRYHIDMNSRDTLDTQLNVLADFDPILPDSYKKSEYVMLGNLTPMVQMRVIEQLENAPKFLAMDTMNFWMDNTMDSLMEVISKVDALLINDEEARQLSGEYSLVRAAQKIHKMGPRQLVIKKGEHGALLFEDHHVFFAPALPLADVFDPTGAGDTFAGGLMGFIAKTGDVSFDNLKKGIIFGSALASFCVEKFSIQRMLELDSDLIKQRIQRFVDLVNFSGIEYDF